MSLSENVVLVDVGNTSIKTAELIDGGISEIRRFTSTEAFHDSYSSHQKIVCSVRPETSDSFENVYLKLTQHTQLPIKLDYSTPETLGHDRIAGMVGCWSLFPNKNVLLIDQGTCITYDLLTKDGKYIGGIISPGLEIRAKAMHSFTANLPNIMDFSETESIIGKSTTDCMRIGLIEGVKNEINGFLASFNKKFSDLHIVVTGRGVSPFDSTTKKPIFASSKIVLEGLYAIWKFNEAN